jgi:hypothetical protein
MATTAPDENQETDRQENITETIAAVLLSIAALASSYAGFQAGLWDGEQAANYALAEQARTAASKEEMVAGQHIGADAMIFIQWLNASETGNHELEQFYRQRFRPEFNAAFEKWIATRPLKNPQAPPTPFQMPGYREKSQRQARAQSAEADQLFKEGQRANQISDTYGQAVVIMALSLFLGGIIQGFNVHRTRVLLLALSGICLLIGLLRIAFLPAIRLI